MAGLWLAGPQVKPYVNQWVRLLLLTNRGQADLHSNPGIDSYDGWRKAAPTEIQSVHIMHVYVNMNLLANMIHGTDGSCMARLGSSRALAKSAYLTPRICNPTKNSTSAPCR